MTTAKQSACETLMLQAFRLARRGYGTTSLNPNGISSISPGLRGTRYPESTVPKIFSNPNGVVSPFRAQRFNLFRVDDIL